MKTREWNPRPISGAQVKRLVGSMKRTQKQDASYPIIVAINPLLVDAQSMTQELRVCKPLAFAEACPRDQRVIHLAEGQHRIQAARQLRREAESKLATLTRKLNTTISKGKKSVGSGSHKAEADARSEVRKAEVILETYSYWVAKVYSLRKSIYESLPVAA